MSPENAAALRSLPVDQCLAYWNEAEKQGRSLKRLDEVVRELVLADLYYLLVRVCKREDLLPVDEKHPKPGFINNQFAFDRCREVQANPDGFLDLWAREHWKDLADDTPMLTQNRGWTTHGDLAVGDSVFAPNGQVVRVLALSARFETSPCYRVTFHDGAQVVAGAGHLWKLRVKHKLRIANSELRQVVFSEKIVTTDQLSRRARCDVGVCEPLEMPHVDLPIAPYVLGAWLGDGTSSNGGFCGNDEEIFARIESLGYAISPSHCPQRAPFKVVTIYGLSPKLRLLGVMNNKNIPQNYMTASIEQRMELLRGLMDTDGHCNSRGTATFVNINERLVNQVFELAVGLGLRPRLNAYPREVNGAPYGVWFVSFQAHKDRNPFHLSRKAQRAIESYLHRDTRLVWKIEKISSVPTRCIQVEGSMYLAGRQLIPTHNSSIITFGLTIQDILSDPDTTFGFFSHTRPIAKAFLRQIQREFESNKVLHTAFPDVLWGEDTKQSPKWSEDDGIIVKRKSNPNEATIEAWGLVDGQPTSKHFKKLLYDDVVVAGSVTNPEMIEKVMVEMERSYNLGTTPGVKRFVGTRWNFADAYKTIMERKTAIGREYPGREGGTEDGKTIVWDEETHQKKRRDYGPYTYAAQILLNPKADALQGFQREWLRYYISITASQAKKMTKYILVDSANEKRKYSDYTAIWVVGLGADGNYYALDIVRDRLNLTERTNRLFMLYERWKPIKEVRWERYGLSADVQHVKSEQEARNYRFDVIEVGGISKKEDRIGRLIPIFEQGKFYLPKTMHTTNYEKITVDLVRIFIEEEYAPFPTSSYKDMMDSLSRIAEPDLKLSWPREQRVVIDSPRVVNRSNSREAWMG